MGKYEGDMNNDFMDYVEKRLITWAEWFTKGDFNGLGFHSKSIEFQIMFNRNCAPRGPATHLPINESAEEIENLVREMSHYDKKMAKAIRCFYFLQGPLRVKAKRAQISHTHFKRYVDLARQWLVGRLSVNCAPNKINNIFSNLNL